MEQQRLKTTIRTWVIVFIIGLALSGITAFPLETEVGWMNDNSGSLPPLLQQWISIIYNAISVTNKNYPYMAYGTDWLAFGHLVIAMAFIGPLIDPVRNVWIIQFGMIACVMVFPLAFIAGPIRHIPFYWQLIDCSFGFFGFFPLFFCYRKIRKLERLRPGTIQQH